MSLAATARGRRFLAEVARRARSADTQALFDAVAGLERRAAEAGPGDDGGRLQVELGRLLEEVRHARAEIADSDGTALDPLLQTAARASSTIQDATEEIQDTAWTMREAGFEPALCDLLDRRAADIHRACTRQARTTRSFERLIQAFARIESRLAGLVGLDRTVAGALRPPEPDLTPAPAPVPSPLGPPEGAEPRPHLPPAPPSSENAAAAARAREQLERFAALDIRDRLRLFT